MEVWSLGTRFLLARDALPFQTSALEIQQQSQLKSGDCEVAHHLSNMGIVECKHHLGIDNNFFVHNQIRDEVPDYFTSVEDLKFFLRFNDMTAFPQFDNQGALVKLFIETGLHFIENVHCSPDDLFAELFVNELSHLDHPRFPLLNLRF